jgi:hypothetical protein
MKTWVVFVFTLIALVPVSVAVQNQPAGAKNRQNTQQAAPPVPVSVNCNCTTKADDGKDKPQGWHKLVTWPEGIATWALILTLGAIVWQAIVGRAAASAALKQVNYMVSSERAWVMDTTVVLSSGAKDKPEGSEQVFIQCAAGNEGRTPARVLGMNAIFATGPISDPGKTWDNKLYWFPKTLTPKWTILPDKSSALHCSVPGLTGQPGQIFRQPIPNGETPYIHGVIKYWDVFSETERFTRFCYRYVENPGSPYGFQRAGGGGYNQQT